MLKIANDSHFRQIYPKSNFPAWYSIQNLAYLQTICKNISLSFFSVLVYLLKDLSFVISKVFNKKQLFQDFRRKINYSNIIKKIVWFL